MFVCSTSHSLTKTAVPLFKRTWAATRCLVWLGTRCGNPESHAASKQAATQKRSRAFPTKYLTPGSETEIRRHNHTAHGMEDTITLTHVTKHHSSETSRFLTTVRQQYARVSQSEKQMKAYLQCFLSPYWQSVYFFSVNTSSGWNRTGSHDNNTQHRDSQSPQ